MSTAHIADNVMLFLVPSNFQRFWCFECFV
uniref:Uncharacterized protein n=1 Tax=Tetraselmis sp. GSL018 TaxID=582737 RepID=A0A061RCQ7_9CHLO